MAAKRSARGGKVSLAARRSEARLRRRPEDPGARHCPWLILLGVVLLFQYGSLVAEGGWRAVTGYWSAQAAAIGWDDLASSGVGALLLSALLTAMGVPPIEASGTRARRACALMVRGLRTAVLLVICVLGFSVVLGSDGR